MMVTVMVMVIVMAMAMAIVLATLVKMLDGEGDYHSNGDGE